MNKKVFILIILVVLGIIGSMGIWKYQANKNPLKPQDNVISQITLNGETVCLPHKNKRGPQTLECAFGLKGDDNKYYQLKNLNQQDFIEGKYPTGERIMVTGELSEAEASVNYDIEGYINISSIKKL